MSILNQITYPLKIIRSRLSKDSGIFSFQIYILTGILLALFLPDSIQVPAVISKISTYIPSIENYAQASDFHNVTVVFRTVMWLLMPFFLAYLLKVEFLKKPVSITKEFVTYGELIMLILAAFLGVIFCGFFIAIFVFMPVDISAEVHGDSVARGAAFAKLMSHSKLGLGILGSLEIYGNACFIFCILRAFPMTYWAIQRIIQKLIA